MSAQPCPQCGRDLEKHEDPIGVTYQCRAMDCQGFFDAHEIEKADPECSGCGGGDKVPATGDWRCPVCDAEWTEVDP